MSETSHNNGLFEKIKTMKVSRATAVTVVLLVAALIVIISVTVATNRAKKNELSPEPDVSGEDNGPSEPTVPDAPAEPTVPEQQKPSKNPGSSTVENKLPSFTLPVSGVLSKSHNVKQQVYSTTMKDYRVHLGVDIVTAENAPVYAAADGTISKIWKDTWMGYCIAIQHSGTAYTIYQNLSETLPEGIKEGTAVHSGQLIASVGNSASIEIAEEPHLHFEMTVGDLAVDPLEYFSEDALKSLAIDASYGE